MRRADAGPDILYQVWCSDGGIQYSEVYDFVQQSVRWRLEGITIEN